MLGINLVGDGLRATLLDLVDPQRLGDFADQRGLEQRLVALDVHVNVGDHTF